MNEPNPDFRAADVHCEMLADGVTHVLRATAPLASRLTSIDAMLRNSAAKAPERIFLRERQADGWRALSYGSALGLVRRLANGLLARGLSRERPLAVLSGNGIDHALLALAAMSVGIPVAPISTAYSQYADLARLRDIFNALTPGLVYAADAHAYARGLKLAQELGCPIAASVSNDPDLEPQLFSEIAGAEPIPATHPALGGVGPDTLARILFTSGSTGTPKGVMITQGMMCTNQDAVAHVWPFLEAEPPEMVDWLPWNHVYGGCLNFNCVLRNSGTLVIDDGKPVPGQFSRSIEAIKAHPPTVYLGVPRALVELVTAFSRDAVLEQKFFSRLKVLFSAGAALPATTWDSLNAACLRVSGKPLNLFIGYGATETAPVVSITSVEGKDPHSIGFPIPGAQIKLTPNQDKLEIRLKGPMVTPGYWRAPELTKQAFDEDGFYKIGDAGRLDDQTWRRDGIRFDGRVAENFKLLTGVWVNAGAVRLAAISAGAPVIEDVVVTGHDSDEVGLLIFPGLNACRNLCGNPQATLEEIARDPRILAIVRKALQKLGHRGGSSFNVRRALILTSPPSMESGEMTDKGYLNQRAALSRRAADVTRLYAPATDAAVIAV